MRILFISRHVIPVCLALIVLAQAFDKGLIWSGFYMNQSYIAAELCEEREVPESPCGGECHLHKALEKANEKETQHTHGEKQVEWMICQQPVAPTPKYGEDNAHLSYHLPTNDSPYTLYIYHKLTKPPDFFI